MPQDYSDLEFKADKDYGALGFTPDPPFEGPQMPPDVAAKEDLNTFVGPLEEKKGVLGTFKQTIDRGIAARRNQLSGEEPGILNPEPNKNTLIDKPLLEILPRNKRFTNPELFPEDHRSTAGKVVDSGYDVIAGLVNSLTSPLGIYGTLMGSNPADMSLESTAVGLSKPKFRAVDGKLELLEQPKVIDKLTKGNQLKPIVAAEDPLVSAQSKLERAVNNETGAMFLGRRKEMSPEDITIAKRVERSDAGKGHGLLEASTKEDGMIDPSYLDTMRASSDAAVGRADRLKASIDKASTRLKDETGALFLSRKSKPDTEVLRKDIISTIIRTGKVPNLNEFHKNSGLSKNAFGKLIDDIIDSGDLSRIKPESPVPQDTFQAVNSLLDRVKQHVVARNEQDVLVKAERFKRITAAKEANVPGIKGHFLGLKELKGEYPKAKIDDFAGGLNPADIDLIKDAIFAQPQLDQFAKHNTTNAFLRAIGKSPIDGALQPGEIRLLENVFGKEAVSDLVEMHSGLGLNPENATFRKAVNIGNDLKGMRSADDIGWMFRQGALYGYRPAWFKAIWPSMKSYASEGQGNEILDKIRKDPEYNYWSDAGLPISDFKSKNYWEREEQNVSDIGERLGKYFWPGKILGWGIKASNRAAVAGVDSMRFELAKGLKRNYQRLYESMKKTATTPEEIAAAEEFNTKWIMTPDGPKVPPIAKRIANSVATGSGKGELPQSIKGAAPALNAALFSPQLQASRIRSMNRLFNPMYYMRADPVMRKESLKQLLSLAGVLSTGYAIKALHDGKLDTDITSLDATSTDFLKSQFGNVRLDSGGGMLQYIVPAMRLVMGITTSQAGNTKKLGSFGVRSGVQLAEDALVNNKTSPLGSFASAILNRQEFGGKPLNFNTLNPLENTALQQATPILIQDLYELYQEDPSLIPWLALPDALGMNVSTPIKRDQDATAQYPLQNLGTETRQRLSPR